MDYDVIVIGTGQAGVPLSTRLAGGGKAVLLAERGDLGGTNRGVMELRELPAHLVVVGGGYVGCEFAQLYRRLGSSVTIVEPGPHLLAREDTEVSQAIEGVFRDEGIALVLGRSVEEVWGGADRVSVRLASGEVIEGSHLLVATGRRPNTDDLGCDAAGVARDAGGFVRVDDSYATSAPGVYAVGDCTGGPQFTHTAWDDHRILFDILAGRRGRGRKDRLVPHTAYTDPQVAGVGFTERDARAAAVAHEVASMPFEYVARAIETDEKAGLLKVLVDPATERILGAAIVGAEAGELIHVFAALMQAGATAHAIVDMEAVHPSFSEGVQSVVMALPRYALS